MTIGIIEALNSLRPGSQWTLYGESYGDLVWHDSTNVIPTEQEINAKIVELVAAEPMRLLRKERDRLIAETDWWVLPDRTPTDEQLAYRQALRDLPSTATPVLDNTENLGISGVTWPTKP